MGSALAHLIASGASNFSLAIVHNGPQKEDPGA
jgi:hypothetical protein